MRLLSRERLEDILPENAQRISVWDDPPGKMSMAARRLLVVVAILVILLALALSVWSGAADAAAAGTVGVRPGPLPG